MSKHDPVRVAVAIHESAHAVAYALLGDTIRAISIELPARRGDRRGICFHTKDRLSSLPLPSPAPCAFLMPTSARIHLERDLAGILAGPIATATYSPVPRTYDLPDPEPDEQLAREIVERRHALMEEQASNMLDLEANLGVETTRPADEERAFELSAWVGSSSGAGLHLAWIAWEVSVWVQQPRFRAPLFAVARALLAVGELDGAVVHRLIDRELAAETPRRNEEITNAAA